MQRLARLGRRVKDRQSCPIVGRGQPTRVAVGQDAHSVFQQLGTMSPNIATHLPVFLMDRPGFGQEFLHELLDGDLSGTIGRQRLDEPRHPVNGPKQVDGRRAAGGQVAGHLVETLQEGRQIGGSGGLDPDANPISGRNPDRRGTSDAKHLDRFPDGFDRAAFDFDQFGRQQSLVDHGEITIRLANPMECINIFHVKFSVLSFDNEGNCNF